MATQAGVAIVASPEWVSAENAPNGLPPSGFFVQHAVFKVTHHISTDGRVFKDPKPMRSGSSTSNLHDVIML